MSGSAGIWERIKGNFHKEPLKTRLTRDEVVCIATHYLESKGDYKLREPYNSLAFGIPSEGR